MNFKAKLRKIGNSIGIYIPREVITNYKIGDIVEFDVITSDIVEVPIIGTIDSKTERVRFNSEMCSKHPGSMKGTCGCK